MKIHPTAIISPKAEIDENVEIGPYCVIEEGVKIENGTKLGPYVHVKGRTIIGRDNIIHTGCVIGERAQMFGLREDKGKLEIGNGNIIREYVTIHASTDEANGTKIGDNNYLMGFAHIAHDCKIGNQVIICNGTLLAGHVEVGDKAFISGNVVIHQFVRIGRLAMIAGLARVNQDVPPFMLLVGNSRIWGINLVGLKRAGFDGERIRKVKEIYEILYREGLPLNKALEKLQKINSDLSKEVLNFIRNSKRGISGPHRSKLLEKIFLDYPLLLRQNIKTYKLLRKIR
jgi:UDP-N-acetylglucosamine acyltransferase